MRNYRHFVAVFAAVCVGFAAKAATAIDWVGGGGDNLTTTLANWSVGGETPSELPDLTGGTLAVTLKGGTGITYADGDKFDSIVNDIPVTNAQGGCEHLPHPAGDDRREAQDRHQDRVHREMSDGRERTLHL